MQIKAKTLKAMLKICNNGDFREHLGLAHYDPEHKLLFVTNGHICVLYKGDTEPLAATSFNGSIIDYKSALVAGALATQKLIELDDLAETRNSISCNLNELFRTKQFDFDPKQTEFTVDCTFDPGLLILGHKVVTSINPRAVAHLVRTDKRRALFYKRFTDCQIWCLVAGYVRGNDD